MHPLNGLFDGLIRRCIGGKGHSVITFQA